MSAPRAPETAEGRLATLAIARLTFVARPAGAAEVARQLRRFAPRDLTEGAWGQAVERALAAAGAAGALSADLAPRAGELARRIGPFRADRWPQLAERVLPALGLGVAPSDAAALAALRDRDAWAAAIVARAHGLWRSGRAPSASAVCDALVWIGLGLAGKPGRCPAAVRAYALRAQLGVEAGAEPAGLLRQLAARTVGAASAGLRALRDALVRAWIAEEPLGPPSAGAAAPTSGDRAGSGAAAGSLVAAARAAAAAATTGRFGEHKVFIAAVWRALRATPEWAELPLPELKQALLAAHQRGELVLARADLVAAMDPDLVAASEAAADGASFHFVVREPA
jgi:hypothetical protein